MRPRGVGRQVGARRLLGQRVSEADHLALGRDVDRELLLRQRPEPAMAPAPEAHGGGEQAIALGDPQLALDEGLLLVVVVEVARVPVAVGAQPETAEERARHRLRALARDAELDRRLREGEEVVVHADPQRGGSHHDADEDQAAVACVELLERHAAELGTMSADLARLLERSSKDQRSWRPCRRQ